MNVKRGAKWLARALLPAAVLDRVTHRFFRVRWTGDYATWAEARAASTGYDAPAILEHVAAATRRVRDGRAAYDRDGVVFAEPVANAPMLACLRQAATERGGALAVLDYGGALGSAYWQHRRWLADVGPLTWSVVEQPGHVLAGRREFTNEQLEFFETIAAACARQTPDVALLSAVLPYLEEPMAVLEEIASRGVRWIMIDRTGMIDGPRDRITVQHVPRTLHAASYPCRFFSRERLLAPLLRDYTVWSEHVTEDGHASGFRFGGVVLQRRGP